MLIHFIKSSTILILGCITFAMFIASVHLIQELQKARNNCIANVTCLLAVQLIEWVAHFAGEALCLPVPGDHDDDEDEDEDHRGFHYLEHSIE